MLARRQVRRPCTGRNVGTLLLPYPARNDPTRRVAKSLLKILMAACLPLVLAGPGPLALAEGDPEQGRLLAYTCMGCHGIEGYRNAYPSFSVPRLGGQQRDYIEAALRAYRDGTRPHQTMRAQAAGLTDQDISNIAAWLEQFGTASDGATAGTVGDLDAAVACIACHGQEGETVVPQPPTLAGQYEDYLRHALREYRDGTRSGNVMAAFAAPLSDDDIDSLARFYAMQDGLHTPAGVK